MKGLEIKYQILVITLIPVLLIDFFFTYNSIQSNIKQATELLQTKGQIIGRQLAGASEFNLFTGNDGQILYLLDQSVDTNDIVHAAVYDQQGQLIAESVSKDFNEANRIEYFFFRQPILSESIQFSDVFTPDSADDRQTNDLGWVQLYISKHKLQETTQEIIANSVFFFIIVLLMAVILTIIISKRITRPISRLIEHLKSVETGDLGRTIESVESSEIGALQTGFNQMTQALLANRQYLNQRIEQATQQLNEAISELETKNGELGVARDQAQKANNTKSEFLANMSHEIRTPINGIKGFINLLNQSKLDQSQQRYVEIILKSTIDLTSIINEILDFSKIESGKLTIVNERFDLHDVIEQTRDILFINILTKPVDLNLIIFSDTPKWVIGDKLRLKQILLNLMGNAIKFTDQGQVVITVALDETEDDEIKLKITIEDSGIGISEHDQHQLFQAFSQIESSDNRRFAGTGLGLVISQNLAHLMDGDISLESTLGEGSRFEVRLPFQSSDDLLLEPVTNPLSAKIVSATPKGLMEVRSLFDRAGVLTEAELVDQAERKAAFGDNLLSEIGEYDLLVFDLRHLDLNFKEWLPASIPQSVRIILMHYEDSIDLAPGFDDYQFISVINTGQSLSNLLTPAEATLPPSLIFENDPAPLSQKQVLLVDDNQINLKLASELIRLWGHEVTEIDHGETAFALYQDRVFDLIILDIQMPDIDGVTLLKMMRAERPSDSTPIIALTANILNNETQRLFESGFDYLLEKPIEENKFRALLDKDITRQHQPAVKNLYGEKIDQECALDADRSLSLTAGNQSLLIELLDVLQRDIPRYKSQLEKALANQSTEKFISITHQLQGVTCYTSLPRLKRQIIEVQSQLKSQASLPSKLQVENLLSELDQVNHEVTLYLKGFPPIH